MGSGFLSNRLSQSFEVDGIYISKKFEGQMDILLSHPAHKRFWQGILHGGNALCYGILDPCRHLYSNEAAQHHLPGTSPVALFMPISHIRSIWLKMIFCPKDIAWFLETKIAQDGLKSKGIRSLAGILFRCVEVHQDTFVRQDVLDLGSMRTEELAWGGRWQERQNFRP